jgi:hypothetical protein
VNTGETDAGTGVGAICLPGTPMQHRVRAVGFALVAVWVAVLACDHGPPRGIPDGPPPDEGSVFDGIDDSPIEQPGEGEHSDGSGKAE